MTDTLTIGGREFNSRLFVGTGKFSSNRLMLDSILASESEMITVAMKRIDMEHEEEDDVRCRPSLWPIRSMMRDICITI